MYSLFKTMEEEHIFFSFKGTVTPNLLTAVIQLVESKMVDLDESPKTTKKVIHVLVECLQNLYHHNEHEQFGVFDRCHTAAASSFFMVACDQESFYIRTGNYVRRDQTDLLQQRIETINGMEKEELKVYYQTTLNYGEVSDKGTAGLGLIDIARKSGNKLQYTVIPTDEETAFFCLSVKIN